MVRGRGAAATPRPRTRIVRGRVAASRRRPGRMELCYGQDLRSRGPAAAGTRTSSSRRARSSRTWRRPSRRRARPRRIVRGPRRRRGSRVAVPPWLACRGAAAAVSRPAADRRRGPSRIVRRVAGSRRRPIIKRRASRGRGRRHPTPQVPEEAAGQGGRRALRRRAPQDGLDVGGPLRVPRHQHLAGRPGRRRAEAPLLRQVQDGHQGAAPHPRQGVDRVGRPLGQVRHRDGPRVRRARAEIPRLGRPGLAVDGSSPRTVRVAAAAERTVRVAAAAERPVRAARRCCDPPVILAGTRSQARSASERPSSPARSSRFPRASPTRSTASSPASSLCRTKESRTSARSRNPPSQNRIVAA